MDYRQAAIVYILATFDTHDRRVREQGHSALNDLGVTSEEIDQAVRALVSDHYAHVGDDDSRP